MKMNYQKFFRKFATFCFYNPDYFSLGVLLAILEHLCYILPVYDEQGNVEKLTAGTVAAGYQNFLICIEMFFAAVALKYAFPISVYIGEGAINAEGRSVTMQSISSSLKVNVRIKIFRF